MKCPVCDVALAISSREGIEIDYCAQCRGVWLDRGELDKIIERSAAPAAAAPGRDVRDDRDVREVRESRPEPRYRDDDDYDRSRYKKKRRGSFLEDLFDFD